MKDFLNYGKQSMELAADAIKRQGQNLAQEFNIICQTILDCDGHLVVTGMGKSGHIGRKISATLASTGTPSFFLHPAEAGHGDLGMVKNNDVILALSNSGTASEILTLYPVFKRMGVKIISITGDAKSPMAQESDIHFLAGVEKEACPLNLAPTTSTSLVLALGDAIAVALLNARGFKAEDFAFSHPSGKLGRSLLLRVRDLMHQDDTLPLVTPETKIAHALVKMSEGKLGFVCIVDSDKKLLGIYTDGDLRRSLTAQADINKTFIAEAMSKDAKFVYSDTMAASALKLMQENKITALAVLDRQQVVVGALNIQDILSAGLA